MDSDKEFINTDLSQDEYTKKALKGETSLSSVYMSVVNSKPVVTFLQPIKDENNNIIYHPEKNRINKKLEIPALVSITKDNKNFENSDMKQLTYKTGKDRFDAFYISVPELKSLVVLTVKEKDVKSSSNLVGKLIALMTFIMILVINECKKFLFLNIR
ncbi:PDC sensor domain-containing protein [Clostridium psychrophilum]|uniref:PDC sensor domain-containing protein n=1 Tax=Clostridium psychrophilum TaxID=132926 RepID=UPI001C0E7A78|nr:PDC sensor domain-containing protein [Clostridium psychrophilum]MBU3182380.1 PDC sensor domain-containing protein [Clostridium psychrophilum]